MQELSILVTNVSTWQPKGPVLIGTSSRSTLALGTYLWNMKYFWIRLSYTYVSPVKEVYLLIFS